MFKQIINQLEMMSRFQRRIFWSILVLIGGAICYMVVYVFLTMDISFLFRIKSNNQSSEQEQIEGGREKARNVFDIALPRARQWQEDATLSFLGSLQETTIDRADRWKFIFTSAHKKGRGFLIEVINQSVGFTQEIPYTGSSAEFPTNIISEQEAIKRVHEIKGYEHEAVLGVEAVYGPAEKAWYWGVRTSKGVVTVEAKKR